MSSNFAASQVVSFFEYLEQWQKDLPVVPLSEVSSSPLKTAIISVDVIKGFCSVGPLSSPRVARIVSPIVHLFQSAWEYGIHNILILQDTHEPDAVEFAAFPPHCVRGSVEAETVDELKSLPFFNQIKIFPKNSISSDIHTALIEWMSSHPEIDTYIVVGDCTDLCTYQLSMFFRLDANARQMQRQVIVPADCVDTYDTPLETALQLGIFAHPGDIIHPIFLYHMATNGVKVVGRIE